MAAGFNSSNSTAACIASATESKKIRPTPRLFRQRDDFEFRGNDGRERAFAAGQDVDEVGRVFSAPRPARNRASVSAIPAESVPRFAAQLSMRQVFDQFPLLRQRVVARADLDHSRPSARTISSSRRDPPSCRKPACARRKNCWQSCRRALRANSWPRPVRNKIRAAAENCSIDPAPRRRRRAPCVCPD